jgi:hypothetical protein
MAAPTRAGRDWTPEEIRILEDLYPDKAVRTITLKLKRTWSACRCKAAKRGLVRWGGFKTLVALSEKLGYNKRALERRIKYYSKYWQSLPYHIRCEYPAPTAHARCRSGYYSHKVYDEQAVVDAIEWWHKMETRSDAARRLGVSQPAMSRACKRANVKISSLAPAEPAFWDSVVANYRASQKRLKPKAPKA